MVANDRLVIFVSFTAIIATRLLAKELVLCSDVRQPFEGKSLLTDSGYQSTMSTKILSCDFEIFGIVQGVFFRKYTQKQAATLGVRGWCMNTKDDTVKGQLEGEEKPFNEMKYWLQTKGSPSSRIDKAVFSVPKEVTSYSFKDFSIRR
ncbi:acylphosphatase-2-like [Anopheles ziemanni]|nr:acylphosphatase-2-like [Anopheles ziemanni]